jgi:hypothetical protein
MSTETAKNVERAYARLANLTDAVLDQLGFGNFLKTQARNEIVKLADDKIILLDDTLHRGYCCQHKDSSRAVVRK